MATSRLYCKVMVTWFDSDFAIKLTHYLVYLFVFFDSILSFSKCLSWDYILSEISLNCRLPTAFQSLEKWKTMSIE